MQTHQDHKLAMDESISIAQLKLGQWIKFSPISQEKYLPQSQIKDLIFFVYGCDNDQRLMFNTPIYKLIGSDGIRYNYDSLKDKLDGLDVSSFNIFLIPAEKAKKICGHESLKQMNKKLQVQIPQDAYERVRKGYSPIKVINRFDFQQEVDEFIQQSESLDKKPLRPGTS